VAEGRELPELEHVTVSARAVHPAELVDDPRAEPVVEQLQLPARRLRAAEQ
jgi:hypothetical protein